jgi:hypothetical protein
MPYTSCTGHTPRPIKTEQEEEHRCNFGIAVCTYNAFRNPIAPTPEGGIHIDAIAVLSKTSQ